MPRPFLALRILLIIIALLSFPLAAAARPKSTAALAQLNFDSTTWTTEQGLPGDTVRAITQTKDGYLWIGTQAGLARFDGVRFTVFSKTNAPEFRTNECAVLLETSDGALWIGTVGGGLMRYKDGHFKTYGRPEGLPNDTVVNLYEDHSSRLWITSYENITVFAEDQFKNFNVANEGRTVYAIPLHEDDAGRIWFFNSRGLNHLNSGLLSYYSEGQIHSGDDASLLWPFKVGEKQSLFAGLGGSVWVNDLLAPALSHRRDSQSEQTIVPFPGKADLPTLLHEDSSNNLWFLSLDSHLRVLRQSKVFQIKADSLPSGVVNTLFADHEKNVWIGSSTGLTRLKPQPFAAYSTREGLSNETAWTIFEDSKGDLWIGTNKAANRFRDGRFLAYTHDGTRSGNSVISIAEDSAGRMWFATTQGLTSFKDDDFPVYDGRKNLFNENVNVVYVDNSRYHVYGRRDGLLSENVRSVFVDSGGRLWVGTVGGLHLFENEKFKSFTTADGLSNDHVLFIQQDRSGALWIGTTGGLNRLHDGRFEVFTTANGLPSNIVIAVHQDADGYLWFGFVGGGLSRFKDGKFQNITPAAGLGDDTIESILEDDRGNLWMGSTRGVLRVKLKELNDVADGLSKSFTCIAYGKADGLPSTDCSGGTQPAGWRTRDGRLWFPTANGIAVVDPHSLERNDLPPPVVIEGLTVDREAQTINQKMSLSPGSRSIEIHFTALSFRDPAKVKFKYMLEGFDGVWQDAGTRREAFYTNLPPGHFRFRVIAANDDGVWNEQGSTLGFTLRPYFYQTFWFYLVCALVLAAATWGIHLLRVRQLRREFAAVLGERNRIARDMHDTLAQGFTSVSMQLEAVTAKLSSAPESALEHLNLARLLVRSSLAEARRSVRDLRSEFLESNDIGQALTKIAQDLTAGTGVRIEVAVNGSRRSLSDQIENTLLRVGQEALTNATRHGEMQHATVRLSYQQSDVVLEIADDGKGIDQETSGSANNGGFGLRGMHERLAQVGGKLTIESQPGAGTVITAVIPTD